AAADWAMRRLREYGLENVQLEAIPLTDIGDGLKWAPVGWSYHRCSVVLLEPQQAPLRAVPVFYSAATQGRVSGDALFASLPRTEADVRDFIQRFRGHLASKIVMMTDVEAEVSPQTAPLFRRYTDEELSELERLPATPAAAPAGTRSQVPQSSLKTVATAA